MKWCVKVQVWSEANVVTSRRTVSGWTCCGERDCCGWREVTTWRLASSSSSTRVASGASSASRTTGSSDRKVRTAQTEWWWRLPSTTRSRRRCLSRTGYPENRSKHRMQRLWLVVLSSDVTHRVSLHFVNPFNVKVTKEDFQMYKVLPVTDTRQG